MALTQVSSAGIKNAEVKTEDILDANITTAKIAADSITGAKIADDAVGAEHIELLDAPLHIADSTNLVIGTGSDLKLWHYSDHSYIRNETGNLTIEANSAGDDAIKIIPDGAVELYHNNIEMFYTSASGCHIGRPSAAAHLHFLDGGTGRWGTGNDLEIVHDGTDTTITNNTGNLLIYSTNDFYIKHGTEVMLAAKDDDAVELYHDGTKRLATTSGGVHIYNALGTSGAISIGNGANLILEDNGRAVFGFGSDLQIYHDGNNSYVEDSGTGSLILKTGRVSFNDTGNNEMGRFDGEGLKFNGDSAAANALDDYEEGDFTAYIGGQTNKATYNQSGNAQYTKIGRLVYVHGYFAGINIDDNAAGQALIYGLPFTPTHRSYGGAATASVHISNVNFDPGKRQTWLISTDGLWAYESTDNGTHGSWSITNFTNDNTFLWFTATYITTT